MQAYRFRIALLLPWSGFFSSFFFLQSCSYSARATKRLFKQAQNEKYDLIIVPGVPFENGKWSRTMRGRVYWSKYLYDHGIAANIMYSGSAVYSPYYEGEIMALYARALGIPAEHVFVETKAEHSTENLYYSYKKASKMGFKHMALASDPFQTKLLKSFGSKKMHAHIGFIPMVMDTLRKMEPAMEDPEIPYQQAFDPQFVPLKEREGFWKRLMGTMGKNIDYNAY